MGAGPGWLELVGAGAAIYGLLIVIAAVATWRRAPWGEWLMLGVFLSALPMEIWEITKEPSVPHGAILALTLLGLGLLLREMQVQARPLPFGRGRPGSYTPLTLPTPLRVYNFVMRGYSQQQPNTQAK